LKLAALYHNRSSGGAVCYAPFFALCKQPSNSRPVISGGAPSSANSAGAANFGNEPTTNPKNNGKAITANQSQTYCRDSALHMANPASVGAHDKSKARDRIAGPSRRSASLPNPMNTPMIRLTNPKSIPTKRVNKVRLTPLSDILILGGERLG
jgi:hypothetical protein